LATKKKISRQIKKVIFNPAVTTLAGFFAFLLVISLIIQEVEHSRGGASGFDTFFHSLWFSIVTVTTVGYGDIAPKTQSGQLVTMFLIFGGIGYAGVLTGAITSWLVERNRRRVAGLVPLKKAHDKLLICGWKPNMREMLKSIIKISGCDSSDLVLLNQMNHREVQDLRKDPLLEDFHYYSGDDTNLEDLRKANAHTARKILVLADHRPEKSPEEIDFQSILTSLAVNKLSPGTYQIVELILPKFRLYINQARVEEVIFNEVYARSHLVNIALMSGMNNLLLSFFDIEKGVLKLRSYKPGDVGRTYGELKAELSNQLVIGVLENVGNLGQRKRAKLNQIQRTPKIAGAIEGLWELKKMQANHPVILPPDHYVLKEGCDLIILDINPNGLHLLNPENLGNILPQERHSHRVLVTQRLREALFVVEDWVAYFALIQERGLEPYLVEDRLVGFSYFGQNLPFERLKIGQDLADLVAFQFAQVMQKGVFLLERQITGMQSPLKFAQSHGLENLALETGAIAHGPLMIIGWKKEMVEMILSLLEHQNQPGVRWQGISIVADLVEEQRIEFRKAFGDRPEVQLFSGDPVSHQVLNKAGLKQAKKVLILSETGLGKSTEEIDAQTALACMVVQEINKKAYIVAEVQSSKYLETLARSKVEEIFSIDQFANIMLANGAHARGTSNIIRDMVATEHGILKLLEVEERFFWGPFGELVHDTFVVGRLVLGVLEEAGNLHVRKSERIAEAKIKADIAQSVESLKRVREVAANKVILAPPIDYIIKPHSRMILMNNNCASLWDQKT